MKNQRFMRLRLQRGYTQGGLGTELGIAGDYVNRIENGRRKPGLALAKRFADLFGVTVDELFFEHNYEHTIGEQNITKKGG